VSERRAPAVGEVDVVAGVVGVEQADAEGLGEREHVVLGRPDEGAAALGDGPVAQVEVEDAAADAVAGLEHHHRLAGAGDAPRRSGQRSPPRRRRS
jgi:hypothetical protein